MQIVVKDMNDVKIGCRGVSFFRLLANASCMRCPSFCPLLCYFSLKSDGLVERRRNCEQS